LLEVHQELKNSAHHSSRSEKLPGSKHYAEEREDKLHQFIFALDIKLRVNADRYSTSDARLAYACTRLTGNASAQVLSRLTAQHNKTNTMKQLIVLLKQAYDDLDKQNTAQRYISELKIKNWTFTKYLFDFQQHIDVTSYDILSQKFNLENELFNEIKTLLIQVNVSSLIYDQLIIKCQQLNNRYRAFLQYTPKLRTFPTTPIEEQSPFSYSVKTQVTIIAVIIILSSEDSMNLSAINMKKRGPLIPEERQYRMNNHLCLYCD